MPSRIVVRGTNWVGDTVMSLPAVKELRRIFPSARLTTWVPSNLVGLMEATGIPDEVISFDRNFAGPLRRSLRMRGKLAAGGFDMAVLLQNAFESAFTVWLARIPLTLGYPTDLRGPLLSVKVPLTSEIKLKHQVFYYLAISDYVEEHFHGRQNSRHGLPDCSMFIGAEALNKARSLLLSLDVDMSRPLISLCPGSVNSEAKRWPADHFASLGDLFVDGMNAQIVFLGAPQERGLIDGIKAAMMKPGAVNMAGRADIRTSMAIMNLSGMVISNDTGSAHLAVAASAKVLTLFGPTSAGATAPYGPDAHTIEGNAPCAPCRHFRCPEPGHPCLRSISPAAVLGRVEEILLGARVPRDRWNE